MLNINKISPYVKNVKIHISETKSQSFIDTEYVFTYIFSGHGRIVLEGREYSVKTGDIVFMPPYMLHIIIPAEKTELIQYIIHFDLFTSDTPLPLGSQINGISFDSFRADSSNPETLLTEVSKLITPEEDDSAKIKLLFLEMKQCHELADDYSILLKKSLMIQLLVLTLKNASKNSIGENRNKHKSWNNLERAINYMHQNYSKKITLEQISKHAGLSLNYLCYLFKDYTNFSIHQYLNFIRIERAKHLIDEGKENFTQIAEKVGFSNIHNFSKTFKKMTGITLSEYQKIRRNSFLR